MRTFPVELTLADREALFIGSFPELSAKVHGLLEGGARVTLVTDAPPDAAPRSELAALADRVTLHDRRASDDDVAGKAIVFVAPWTTPEDEARARRWHASALQGGTLLCTVDRPETCTFVNAAVLRVPALTMTFASGGRSPSVVKRIREDLEVLFSDPRFTAFVDALATLRASLPRGERGARMAAAVQGFAVDARLRFPAWFERGRAP